MPIYEFRCKKCNAHIEVFQKLSDKPPARCKKCGGRLEKLASAPAIQFKGEGWYVTDYSRKGNKPEKESSATETPAATEKAAPKETSTKKNGSDTT